MIMGKYLSSMGDISPVLEIRNRVFSEIMPDWASRDSFDDMAVYALVLSENEPAACGRLVIDNDRFTVSRVAVLQDKRHMGLGDMLIRMLLIKALDLGATEIFVSPLPEARGFYKKYGFEEIDGTTLKATPDSISRAGGCSGCCGH